MAHTGRRRLTRSSGQVWVPMNLETLLEFFVIGSVLAHGSTQVIMTLLYVVVGAEASSTSFIDQAEKGCLSGVQKMGVP